MRHGTRAAWRRPVLVLTLVVLAALTVVTVIGLTGPSSGAVASTPTRSSAGGEVRPGDPDPDAAAVAEDRSKCPPSEVACVDTRLQRAWLQRGDAVVFGPVPFLPGAATGLAPAGPKSTATPLGRFHVLSKDATHRSTEFDEAMPDAVFFAPGGIAFHEGSLAESSHGCVHLDPSAAAAFFAGLRTGDGVAVF